MIGVSDFSLKSSRLVKVGTMKRWRELGVWTTLQVIPFVEMLCKRNENFMASRNHRKREIARKIDRLRPHVGIGRILID